MDDIGRVNGRRGRGIGYIVSELKPLFLKRRFLTSKTNAKH
jgi:hypothetical protein